MPRFDTADVRRYYERHTKGFVRFGQGGGSIHRAVWSPGTTTRDHAFHDVDSRIADLAGRLSRPVSGLHVVDLGCGVGASLCYLAERLPMRGTGLTLSPTQVAIASQRIDAAGLSSRVQCLEADYNNLPPGIEPADLAYAIESFVHGPSPARFFAQCAHLVKPGGLLVICDDVRRTTTPEASATIDEFVNGWHINALLEPEALHSLATAAGFRHESTTDLTPFLEIRRGRDRVIAHALGTLRRLGIATSRVDPLLGGRALQTCLARGWIGYEFAVFRRESGQ